MAPRNTAQIYVLDQLSEVSISLGAGLKQDYGEETGGICKCQKQISTVAVKSSRRPKVRSQRLKFCFALAILPLPYFALHPLLFSMRCLARKSFNSILWSFGFVIVGLNTASAFTQCYYPDGSIPTDYIWEPCTGSQYSSCCIPTEGDICQENGLCYYPPNGEVYRGTCTDQTWDDPACPSNICVSGRHHT